MKTAKLIMGIISIVLFGLIVFQSCAAGFSNALEENGENSGTAGLFLAICMLVAGIVGIATRKGKAGGIVSGVFYLVGGVIGFSNAGSFSDLIIWGVLSVIFGIVFILGSVLMKKTNGAENTAEKEEGSK